MPPWPLRDTLHYVSYSEDFLADRGSPADPGYVKFLEQKCEIILHTTPGDATLHDVTLTPPFPYASAYVNCNADHQPNPQRLLPEHTSPFFRDCSLRRTDFSDSLGITTFSRFLHCDLTEAKFTNSSPRRSAFVHCDLTRANFSASDLNTAVFIDCDLTQTSFSDATLWAAVFVGCNTQDAYMLGGLVVPDALGIPGYKEDYSPASAPSGRLTPLALDISWLKARAAALGCPASLVATLVDEHPRLSPKEVLALCSAARLRPSDLVTY